MKTKTMIKFLSVFFTLSLFLTSCSSDEVLTNEEVENIISNESTSNNSSSQRMTQTPVMVNLEIVYHDGVTEEQKAAIREQYLNAIGFIIFIIVDETTEIWHLDINAWNNYQTANGTNFDDDVEAEEEVKEVQQLFSVN